MRTVDVGFDTIGNATLIVHDQGPVLVTDPWVAGGAYFGSWGLSHAVPDEQLEAVRRARFVWFSHGHPDHLNGDSLPLLEGKQILLPDHRGGRIHGDLLRQGFAVRLLRDREWTELSPRIRVACVADYNQDAVLLVDVNGRLVVDLNDASDRGWGGFVRATLRRYRTSYLLALHGFGDADMLNYFDESGARLPLPPRAPLGQTIAAQCDYYGVSHFIPFSSKHRYQREDSAWAASVSATLDDYGRGFRSPRCTLLPAFLRVDCERDEPERIDPAMSAPVVHPPEHFGDDWSQPLEPGDMGKLERYFGSIDKVRESIDFLAFRVGGRDHYLHFRRGNFLFLGRRLKGLTIAAPRNSLMAAVEHEIFDDLLIGNFARVTLHGDWGPRKLYPDFTPAVAKYADNGRARTRRDLARYFADYRNRDPLGYSRHLLDARLILPIKESAANAIRGTLGPDSRIYQAAKKTYWTLRRAL